MALLVLITARAFVIEKSVGDDAILSMAGLPRFARNDGWGLAMTGGLTARASSLQSDRQNVTLR
ncbi:MAG TPA: hypothetical protein DEQ14_04160 [Treponema sp.]|nr:hypothetical protein [Treponema sp.]